MDHEFVPGADRLLGYRRAVRTTRSQAATPPSEMRVGDYRLRQDRRGRNGSRAPCAGADRVALKVLRPTSSVTTRLASASLARWPHCAASGAPGSPRSSMRTPGVRRRTSPPATFPGSRCTSTSAKGPIEGDDLRYFAAGLAGGPRCPLRRRPAPRHQAVQRPARGARPVLIDFGLARLADDPRLTVTGWLLGTPGYLAPGDLYGEEITTASDVHSWGATVAFAAAGTPPFGRGPAMAIMDRVRRGDTTCPVSRQRSCRWSRRLYRPTSSRPSLPAFLADLRPRVRPCRRPAHDAPGPRESPP